MPTVKQARDELGRLLAAIYFIVDSLILLKMLYFIMELKEKRSDYGDHATSDR